MKRLMMTLLLGMLGYAGFANAHEVRPAYLEITEHASGGYEVLWKQPTAGEMAVRLIPHLSNGWLDEAPAEVDASTSFTIKVWRRAERASLDGQTIAIEGLEQTITDVLVSVTLADGVRHQEILKPSRPSLILNLREPSALPVLAYLRLGIEHILTGVDHLLFVLGLVLIVQGRWRLLSTITAFTVAHSITLALAALGWIQVQPVIIEALIALSIVFVAVELVRLYRGNAGLIARYPWFVAFAFGLLHGLAFAGALTNIGLPRDAIPLSLFLFNVGVEIGQLLFVAVVTSAVLILRRLPRPAPGWLQWIPPYAIGSFAAFWLIERTVAAIG
jgi:hydrogenase/urease accessory protein HupE